MEAALGIIGNNSVKAPVKTGFRDPLNLSAPIYGDLQTRSMYANQAAKVRSKANQPVTSDASLHSARQLEAESQASDLTAKGWYADSNMIKQTTDRSAGLEMESAKSRKDAHDYNRGIMDENNIARTTL
jgi:hypothetical protein